MRIQHSLLNIFFGITGQIISSIMGFILRTVFIYTLGIEYLGVDGLFSSILVMLSLANLGFDTAIIYSLYQPLAEKNTDKIMALMNLYKKAYRFIGLVVLLIGVSISPFLNFFISDQGSISNIKIIYFLFLTNSVLSYYFIYKQSLIIADQKTHIISKIHTIFIILSNIFQIIMLLIFGNFILILIIQILMRVTENIYIAIQANRLYPYLTKISTSKLKIEEKRLFFKNLYALMMYKISGVVINGTDNILISYVIGITSVGIYSNYLLILGTLNTFLSYLFFSITASVGNLNVNEDSGKKLLIFKVLNFSNFWIYGFCSVFLWNLLNPFINFWLGNKYTFSDMVVFVIILNFFTNGMQNAATTFRDTSGTFRKGRYNPILAAVLNLVFSIVLLREIGIGGVFLGTVISRLGTYFWFDPYVIFKYVFMSSSKIYFKKYLLYFLLVVSQAIAIEYVANIISDDWLYNILIRFSLCMLVPNILFFVIFRNSEELKYLFSVLVMFRTKIHTRKSLNKTKYV